MLDSHQITHEMSLSNDTVEKMVPGRSRPDMELSRLPVVCSVIGRKEWTGWGESSATQRSAGARLVGIRARSADALGPIQL